MKRKAFVMSVNRGMEEEYERRHSPIWPELEAVLKRHGVLNYSIFLDRETRQLFGYAEIEDEERWSAIAQTAVCKNWWEVHEGNNAIQCGQQPGFSRTQRGLPCRCAR